MSIIDPQLLWFDDNNEHIAEIKRHPEYKAKCVAEEPEAGVCAYYVYDAQGNLVKPPTI